MTRKWGLSPRQSVALLALAAVGMLIVGAVDILFIAGPATPPAVDQPLPPVAVEPLKDTDLNQVKQAFGPFTTIAVSADSPTPETHSPAVLLLRQDGSTQASENWTVPFNSASWKQGNVPQIRSISLAGGYVTIGTNLNRTFMMRINQPLIFEDAPGQVMAVDAQGNIWAVTTARAEASRQSIK